MMKFIHDMIHMTEGEKLINYWWLWLIWDIVVFIAMGYAYGYFKFRRR